MGCLVLALKRFCSSIGSAKRITSDAKVVNSRKCRAIGFCACAVDDRSHDMGLSAKAILRKNISSQVSPDVACTCANFPNFSTLTTGKTIAAEACFLRH